MTFKNKKGAINLACMGMYNHHEKLTKHVTHKRYAIMKMHKCDKACKHTINKKTQVQSYKCNESVCVQTYKSNHINAIKKCAR